MAVADSKRAPVMRFGIAGLGAGGVNALTASPGLTNHPNVKLVAAADVRQAALDRFASDFGGETYRSVEEMCQSPNIDAVYIVTPNNFHAEHAILAAEHKKHVLADKPMALTLADCDRMIAAAERNGVLLIVGHSQSLDSGILKMVEIVRSGELGRPIMINAMYYSEWLYRPRSREELDPSTLEGSLTLRQGPIQVDIVRLLGGGLVRSVRAMTSAADPKRPVDGSYSVYLEFENGIPATLVFNSYGHFDSAELTWGLGLGGRPRTRETNLGAHRLIGGFARPQDEWEYKESTRLGGSRGRTAPGAAAEKHQMFGLNVVDCEKGSIRMTPDGVMIYGEDEWREIRVPIELYTKVELDVFYRAWANGQPLEYHDGRWGKATTEVCLAILQSARERREILMAHQVPLPADRAIP
jgi:phthalate 4,5-cis-dihydrodiol dehydrogenase